MQITVSLPPAGLQRGAWNHLVALYDGTNLTMYHNGVKLLEKPACENPPCGNIIYPAAYHPGGQCIAGRTELRIGSYQNAKVNSNFAHVGSIKSVRILKRSLSPLEVRYLYNLHASQLINATIPTEEYWAKGLGHLGGVTSPNNDFSNVAEDVPVTLLGRFLVASAYRCVFERLGVSAASSPGVVNCSESDAGAAAVVCPAGRADSLTCVTPFWETGFTSTTLFVERRDDGGNWTRLWQRVCLSSDCGFVTYTNRIRSTWWTHGARNLLNPALEGARTTYRFTSDSRLYKYANATSDFSLASTFAGCGSLARFAVEGAASTTHITHAGRSFLLVANFWDGNSGVTDSSIMELVGAGAALTPVLIQRVATHGARKWALLSVGGRDFLAVANFGVGVSVHAWVGGAAPVGAVPEMTVVMPGASDLEEFTVRCARPPVP
ncbi:hypothetical protein T484DRAFT_1818061 [Baffinella frigidus]|nr:hypothetical protein T484DRAFT_1818061 [Cryptophyta sp. CCMP2293]